MPVQEVSPQMPSNRTTPLSQIRPSNLRLTTQVRTREVRPDVTVPPRTHPQENAEIDVPHTSCILGPLKSLARNKQEGERELTPTKRARQAMPSRPPTT